MCITRKAKQSKAKQAESEKNLVVLSCLVLSFFLNYYFSFFALCFSLSFAFVCPRLARRHAHPHVQVIFYPRPTPLCCIHATTTPPPPPPSPLVDRPITRSPERVAALVQWAPPLPRSRASPSSSASNSTRFHPWLRLCCCSSRRRASGYLRVWGRRGANQLRCSWDQIDRRGNEEASSRTATRSWGVAVRWPVPSHTQSQTHNHTHTNTTSRTFHRRPPPHP